MNTRVVTGTLIAFVVAICVLCAAGAQAQDTPSKKSRPKQQQKVFCAESSKPERFLMVNNVNCDNVCNDVYQEFKCDLKELVAEGWKVTDVSMGGVTVTRPPCECRINGTESIMEKED